MLFCGHAWNLLTGVLRRKGFFVESCYIVKVEKAALKPYVIMTSIPFL